MFYSRVDSSVVQVLEVKMSDAEVSGIFFSESSV